MAPNVPEIAVQEARQRVADGALLLDVREPDEWAAGRAPDAMWIPLGELQSRADEVPSDRDVVVICRAGGRSAQATAFLNQSGRTATNIAGGMQAWAAGGLPVEAEDGTPGRVI